ncbi:MAG: rod shape-determining protein RodA [Gammaproteobacteria bacterium]
MLTQWINRLPKLRKQDIRDYSFWRKLHIDLPLLMGLCVLMTFGLFVLYSAGDQSFQIVEQQGLRFLLGLVVMVVLAQIPPQKYRFWAPWLFLVGVILLVAVLAVGHVGQGARRWLNLGFVRFQPSEIMKFALPMMLAWYFYHKDLPPKFRYIVITVFLIVIPAALTAKEPDLGTALLIAGSGFGVLLLAGIRWRIVIAAILIIAAACPFAWHHMHDYQKERLITFLNPESDPLGTGYHIIQSKIAVGSGGVFGKGWLHGSQSHLSFLPEHTTDFIFAVCGEELGLIGCIALLCIYAYILSRCLYIANVAQDTFCRLLAGSLTFAFFLSMFINIGMVIGILPVVGVPLPLVSYGGSAVVSFLAMFGVLMSIHTHRKLVGA